MSLSLPVIQTVLIDSSRSMNAFQCIGSACEDTCCDGMGVVLDKDTYKKYRSCREPKLKALIDRNVIANRVDPTEINFGMIRPSQGSSCPFLNEARLCSIQATLGESALSRTCSVYPRAMSTVDGIVERSLYLSCPEAARLILLNPEPLRVEATPAPADTDPRHRGFPVLNTARVGCTKPYFAFHEIRTFILSLVQNRTYRLWERLIILGMFCDQLGTIGAQDGPDRIDELIGSFGGYVRDGLFGATLDNVSVQPAAQVSFLLNSLEYRIHSEATGQRFLECYEEFLHGVGVTADASLDELSRRYVEAHTPYHAFLKTHEYILENYVVNYLVRTLFPFGPQTETRGIYEAYVLLVAQYSLVRSLMVGMAAHRGADFGPDHCVKLIQSFAKAIEHNPPYLRRLVESLHENGMTDLAVMAVLVKSPAPSVVQTPAVPAGARVALKAAPRAKKVASPSAAPPARPIARRVRRGHAVPRS